MLRQLQKARIVALLVACLFVPILLPCLPDCYGEDEDVFPSDMTDENLDMDNLFSLPDSQDELDFLRSIRSISLFVIFLRKGSVIEQTFSSCFLSTCLEQIILVLRC